VSCEDVFPWLSADVDGEIGAADAAAVRHHVLSCAECARRHRLLQQARHAFRAVAPAPVTTAFDDDVLRRVRPRPPRRSWWLPAAAAAGIALALMRPNVPVGRGSPHPSAASAVDAAFEIDCTVAGPKLCRPAVPCGEGECAPPSITTLVLAGSRLASNIY